MAQSKNRFFSCLFVAFTAFVVSPLDDIVIAALFGGSLFGFGSTAFCALILGSTVFSIAMWLWRRKNAKTSKTVHGKSLFLTN